MGLPTSTNGSVQSAAPSTGYTSGTEQELGLTQLGAALVQQQLPTCAYSALAGSGVTAVGNSGFNYSTGIPTTAPIGALLYNAGQKTLVIESVQSAGIVADGTQADAHSVWFCLQRPQDTPTKASAYVNQNAAFIKMDAGGYQGAAQYYHCSTTQTVSVVNNGWFPLGNSTFNGAVTGGAVWSTADIDVHGRICLPPLAAMAMAIVAVGATAAAGILAVSFHELPLAAN